MKKRSSRLAAVSTALIAVLAALYVTVPAHAESADVFVRSDGDGVFATGSANNIHYFERLVDAFPNGIVYFDQDAGGKVFIDQNDTFYNAYNGPAGDYILSLGGSDSERLRLLLRAEQARRDLKAKLKKWKTQELLVSALKAAIFDANSGGSPGGTKVTNLNVLSYFDGCDFGSCHGWARFDDPHDYTADVHFYDGTTFLGSTTANLPSEPAVGGNGRHRFEYTPQGLSPGPHTIHAYVIGKRSDGTLSEINPPITNDGLTLDIGAAEIAPEGAADKGGKQGCVATNIQLQLYLPSSVAEGAPDEAKRKLSDVDFIAGRGWKVGEINFRAVATIDTSARKVTAMNATVSPFVSSSAGAIGATLTVGEKTTFLEGASGRAQVNANFKVATPFGAWNPNFNYTLSILTRPSSYSAVSPSSDNPADGLYVTNTSAYC